MRIGVFTDVHANLPALEAVLAACRAERCELIVHTGDAVGYGPHPREVMETLAGLSNAQLIMGNHDEYAVQGAGHPHMIGMDPGERAHQEWVREQLSADLLSEMASWPHRTSMSGPVTLDFRHYARLADESDFAPILRDAPPAAFDQLFDPPTPAIVFHGHDHPAADVQGRSRYVNPGSAGVWEFPMARYAIVTLEDGCAPDVRFGSVGYDGEKVLRDMERRAVPARDYVVSILLGFG